MAVVGIVQGLKERDVTFPVEPMSFPTSAAKHCTSRNSHSAPAKEYQGELVLGETAPSVSAARARRWVGEGRGQSPRLNPPPHATPCREPIAHAKRGQEG